MNEQGRYFDIERINAERQKHEEAIRLMYERHNSGYALSEQEIIEIKRRNHIEECLGATSMNRLNLD